MQDRYIPAFIMLIAGTIASILNMMNKVELITGLKRLLIVLIIFYFIGLAAKAIIHSVLNPKQVPKDKEESEEKSAEVTEEKVSEQQKRQSK